MVTGYGFTADGRKVEGTSNTYGELDRKLDAQGAVEITFGDGTILRKLQGEWVILN